jgi:hypothetical protein
MLRFAGVFCAASLALATAALASHCPMDAAAIDAYLARAEVSDSMKSQVNTLKDEGMALHADGKHAEAEAKLAEAMRMLLNGQ